MTSRVLFSRRRRASARRRRRRVQPVSGEPGWTGVQRMGTKLSAGRQGYRGGWQHQRRDRRRSVSRSTVEVRAERIAHSVTEAAARDLLPKIAINEDIRSDRVSIETERIGGFMTGAAVEVRYHVRAPTTASVRVTTTNGRIGLTGLGGRVVARTTNGGVVARGLTGSVDARAINGAVNVELASVGRDRIELRTTNGARPPDAAQGRRGGSGCVRDEWRHQRLRISNGDLGQSRRRVVGRINGGGTSIELSTTNGAIRVRPSGSMSEAP